jgi:uncharacterized protein YdiU (UPF0061 family)
MPFAFDNTYARLPERFYRRVAPAPVAQPSLIKLNEALARQLGLDIAALRSSAGVAMLVGNQVPEGAAPLAMAYAGHQFGAFVPQLGDGRAILLGEVRDAMGQRYDIQLKGSGRTPFSRTGDGRAWLGPVLREYLVSEAMHALGVPTTRALAAVATGESVYREALLPGAVLSRVARSHVRIGTFEYFLARRDTEALAELADYVIDRHYPEARAAQGRYLALLEGVIARQADLVAQWLAVGFIHGVMNTDNMSVAAETIDYGPCAFMDSYDPGQVYSSIDHQGRYAYGNQPRIAQWNLARLAQALLPLIDPDETRAMELAQAAIDAFPGRFEQAFRERFRWKVGLFEAREDDADLINDLLQRMAEAGADFTNTFRALCEAAQGSDTRVRQLIGGGAAFDGWLSRWQERMAREAMSPAERAAAMRRVSPAVIPRNHRVEATLAAAVSGDFAPFEELLEVLSDPWSDRPDDDLYTLPPEPHEVVRQTFCGT